MKWSVLLVGFTGPFKLEKLELKFMTRLLATGIAPEWSLHVRMPRVVFLDFLVKMNIYIQTLGTREENTVTNSELYGRFF